VQAQKSETYTFFVRADDGVRLWVDGHLIINNWREQGATEAAASVALTAGEKYDIKIEYYEHKVSAVTQLSWSSASTPKQIIPQSQLYSPSEPSSVLPPETNPAPVDGLTSGSGNGLAVTYFDNTNFSGSSITRVDPQVNFEWDNGSPDAAIGADTFSARWTDRCRHKRVKHTPSLSGLTMVCVCGSMAI
jgi:hypothetical protein